MIILDKPISALPVGETRKVLEYAPKTRLRGLGVIFISHNVSHVMEVADRHIVIRHGKIVADYKRGGVTEKDVSELITGSRRV